MACHVIHDVTVDDSLRQHSQFVKSIFVHWFTILPPSHTNDVAAYEISTVEIVPISTKMQYHDIIQWIIRGYSFLARQFKRMRASKP